MKSRSAHSNLGQDTQGGLSIRGQEPVFGPTLAVYLGETKVSFYSVNVVVCMCEYVEVSMWVSMWG